MYNVLVESSWIKTKISIATLQNKEKEWNFLEFYETYDGTYCSVFYDEDEQEWTSDNDLFFEHSFGQTVPIDEFDKDFRYEFVIVNNKKSIVSYPFNDLIILNSDFVLLLNVKRPTRFYFSCLDEFMTYYEKIENDTVINKRIMMKGFLIKDTTTNQTFELNFDLFDEITNIREQFIGKNINEMYMTLYQNNKLNAVLPYISRYSNEIVHRINSSMKTLSKEFLNVYHITRQKKNKELYESLSEQYKKVLYELHGIYIKKRKETHNDEFDSSSITVHDVYYFIKNLPYDQLKQIYIDRESLLDSELLIPYVTNCIYTLAQTKLLKD